jgi:hypothetical protein
MHWLGGKPNSAQHSNSPVGSHHKRAFAIARSNFSEM